MLVHIVGGDDDVRVLLQHLAQGGQFLFGVGHAGGVGGAVDHEQAGFRRDRLFQLLRGDLEAAVQVGFQDHRNAAGHFHHVRVADPVGRRDDRFVTVVEQRQGHVEEALLAAAGDQDLAGFVVQAVFTLELVDHGLFETGSAVHRGILGFTGVDRLNGGLFDMIRRIEVRLARTQSNDVLTLGP